MTGDAILCLNWYGTQYLNNPEQSLHRGAMPSHFQGNDASIRFGDATRDLLRRRLLWTNYSVGAIPNGDQFGMKATELGWRVIEHMWPKLRRSQGHGS